MGSRKRNGTTDSSEKPASTPLRIIVRIGALRRFDSLKKKTEGLPVVVSWDRRREDRRDGATAAGTGDRRVADRRQTPPYTWEAADFVVVEDPTAAPADPDPSDEG